MDRRGVFRRCISVCSNPISTVAGAALLLAMAGFASRAFGLIRDRLLASTFGAGETLDVYYAAFRIPDFLYGMLILGALSAAFIPVFSRIYKKDSEKEAWQLTSDLLVFLVGLIALIAVFAVAFMPWLVYLVAPGFDGESREMVILFTRIMLLSPILLGASAVFGGVLVARRSFFAYAVAPILYNIGIIIGVVFLVDHLGNEGLAWGVIVGAFLHLLVQAIAARRIGYAFSWPVVAPWKNDRLRRIFRLMIPQMFSVASNQINFWIITIFASVMTSGSLAVFTFANNLQSIPYALIGISFAVAAFPKLSSAISEDNMKEFVRILMRTVRRILYFVIPASVFLILLRSQVVRVILGTGVFDWEDTVLTYQVLGLLALSLFAQSLIPLLARAFYSLEDTKTPFFIALGAQAVNVIMVALTFERWGVYALAASFSLASIVQVAMLAWVIHRRIGGLDGGGFFSDMSRVLIAVCVSGITIQVIKFFWGTVTNLDTFWEVFGQLALAGSAGIGMYLLMSHLLQISEFHDFKNKVYLRLFGRPKTLVESQSQRDMETM